jgi:hypothetical protein
VLWQRVVGGWEHGALEHPSHQAGFTHASLQVLLPVARVEGPFFSRVISSVCIYFVLSISTVGKINGFTL